MKRDGEILLRPLCFGKRFAEYELMRQPGTDCSDIEREMLDNLARLSTLITGDGPSDRSEN